MTFATFLAQTAEPRTFGWYLGFIIGFSVIVVVVVIVASILTLAARINRQARSATAALAAGRDATAPLWQVQGATDSLRGIYEAARSARQVLEER